MSEIVRILASFSGGRTSAVMTIELVNKYNAKPIHVFSKSGKKKYTYLQGFRKNGKVVQIIVCMANTGKERVETLIFSKECDEFFNLHINLLEAVVHNGERKSSTHKVVKFKNLDKKGRPFRDVIVKYGIPNKAFPHCTRELKTNPIHSFIASIGWTEYITAIGYRIDEPKRFKTKKHGQIYPLVKMNPMTKQDVLAWWKTQPFDLQLEEHQGNCDLCYKKSTPKLLLHIHELKRSEIEWWIEQEADFEYYTPKTRTECNPPYRFFRGNLSIHDLIKMSQELYKDAANDTDEDVLKNILLNKKSEEYNGCEESCEAF